MRYVWGISSMVLFFFAIYGKNVDPPRRSALLTMTFALIIKSDVSAIKHELNKKGYDF